MEGGSGTSTPAVGIDLGTTFSCVGVWMQKHSRVEIVANGQGKRITRSCVSYTESELLVGNAAFHNAARNPTTTIYAAKRLIGRGFSDSHVQNDIKLLPYRVICGSNNKPTIVVEYKGETKNIVAEEISSLVLSHMKEVAETYLGCPVKNVVVTVPAYFNNSQRQSTIHAGEIARLNVLHIMDEPTAAAIAYGFDRNIHNSHQKNVIIFDLGGGTFDVSFVSLNGDDIEVKATGGDTHLGGEDFDNRMVDHFVKEFKRKHKEDISGNSRALWRLRKACEQAKETLSFQIRTNIYIDSFYGNIDFNFHYTQAQFNELNKDLFEKCMTILKNCMNEAKIEKRSIDAVVLVGGSTRIPKVQDLLKEYFEGIEICSGINPDEAVAYGATIQAAKLNFQGNKMIQDLVIKDVTPLSLGIRVLGGKMSTIIPRNTTVPAMETSDYQTSEDNQTKLTISVYEGERDEVMYNNLLGKFDICDIPPAPRGAGKISVCFEIDANGVLTVSAVNKATGKMEKVTITNENGGLSREEITRMMWDAERYRADDEEYNMRFEAWNRLERFVYDMKNASKNSNVARKDTFWDVIEEASNLVEQDSLPNAAHSKAMLEKLKTLCRSLGLCD